MRACVLCVRKYVHVARGRARAGMSEHKQHTQSDKHHSPSLSKGLSTRRNSGSAWRPPSTILLARSPSLPSPLSSAKAGQPCDDDDNDDEGTSDDDGDSTGFSGHIDKSTGVETDDSGDGELDDGGNTRGR